MKLLVKEISTFEWSHDCISHFTVCYNAYDYKEQYVLYGMCVHHFGLTFGFKMAAMCVI